MTTTTTPATHAAPHAPATGITNPNIATAAAPVAPPAPAPAPRPLRKPGEMKSGWYWGTGRRKTAVARVRLRPAKEGEGKLQIQTGAESFKTVEEYFKEERDRNDAVAPLKVTSTLGKLDVVVRLSGGGYMGQAGAVVLGIARALRDYDPTLEEVLRDKGMLTRDSRDVERKKYGQAGARRRFQFSKR
jgi:small subunit ribosomal protein S9